MRYQKFTVNNFKAIKNAEIDLTQEGLVLLLGLNESGKTSVLRAIEAFDSSNDIEDADARLRFYKGIRNKKEVDSTASVTAQILIEKSDKDSLVVLLTPHITQGINPKDLQIDTLQICRLFEYKNAEFVKDDYQLMGGLEKQLTLANKTVESNLCKEILKILPSIQYFEDFKDQIPDFISIEASTQYYDPDWASTIEGMFFHADPKITVTQFSNLVDKNPRQTVLNKVNKALNKQFTERWNKKLKGTKSIHKVELVYFPEKKLFTFEIVGADGVTVFAIEERSKGALWYLTFLLKTEFRKRKLRAESGKTLYLIDEPGSNLHSSAQTNMVEDFRTLASDSNVIYTTHSQYLIDKENLSNVYIVQAAKGVVKVTKYQQYLQGKNIETSYYQPIIDALEIQPFTLDAPWKKVVLVEGVYDYCGFRFMFEQVLKKKLDFVIMPGTGASTLKTLISLHVGWGASTFVLLDNDDEGRANKASYQVKFPHIEKSMHVLDFIGVAGDCEFEQIFTDKERKDLSALAGFSGPVTKKVFQQTLASISTSATLSKKATKLISSATEKRFKTILSFIEKTLA